jgi:hypothetical protein
MWAYLRNVFRQFKTDLSSNRAEFMSPYPPEECIRRLREDIGREPFFRYVHGTHPMMGRVWKNKIWVRTRIDDGEHFNALQTWLTATFEPEGFKTRIRCRFGLASRVWWTLIFWFGFIGSMCITGLVTVPLKYIIFAHLGIPLTEDAYLTDLLLLVLLLVFAGGIGLVRGGRYQARDEQALLIDILTTKLNARPAQFGWAR